MFDEKKGKKKKNLEKEKKLLSNEEKYEIANFESEALKKNIDEGRIKSDSILETLRVLYTILNIEIIYLKWRFSEFNDC